MALKMDSVHVKEHVRKIEFPGSQLPTLLGIVHVLGELAKQDPRLGMKLMGSLWHTYRAMGQGVNCESDDDKSYLKCLGAFLDFYFDYEGDFERIEKMIRRNPVTRLPAFDSIYQHNACKLWEAARELAKVNNIPIQELNIAMKEGSTHD